MSQPVIALYPGTFDPITLGHEDIVRRAARMFDLVVIAVARAHHKKTMFDLDQRLEMTRQALADCPNVRVETFDGLVIEFAKTLQAKTMVRGTRFFLTPWTYTSASPAPWCEKFRNSAATWLSLFHPACTVSCKPSSKPEVTPWH